MWKVAGHACAALTMVAVSAAAGDDHLAQLRMEPLPQAPVWTMPTPRSPLELRDDPQRPPAAAPADRLSPTPPVIAATPNITALSPSLGETGHMNPDQTLTIRGSNFAPTPGATRVGLRIFAENATIPPRADAFVAELPLVSVAPDRITATLPANVAPGRYLAWVHVDGGGHSKPVPLTVVARRTVSLQRVEQDKCGFSARFHLERGGGYWKGFTRLLIGGQMLQIDGTASVSETMTVGQGHALYGKSNLPVTVEVLDPGIVPAKLDQQVTVNFLKHQRLHATDVSPNSLKAGASATVVAHFKTLPFHKGPVRMRIIPSSGVSMSGVKSSAVTTASGGGGRAVATVAVAASASPGKRELRLGADCYLEETLPFSIISIAPPKPALVSATVTYKIHIPFQGQYAYTAYLSIPNATLETITNPNLGLGKSWLVRLPKTANVGSEDCSKPDASFIDLKPGQSTSDFKGVSLYNWGSWMCMIPMDNFTLTQGFPQYWQMKMIYAK